LEAAALLTIFSNVAERILQVIRLCRESRTGWTPGAEMLLGNQISLALNEHGPALNVFWSRLGGMGARPVLTRLANEGVAGVKESCPRKTEPDGAGTGSNLGPLLSVRNWGDQILAQQR